MTNDELKKKIIETLKNTVVNYDCGHAIIAGYFYMEKVFVAFADALIAAGIGDVKAAEHRAEVAEKALKECSKRLSAFTKAFGDGATEDQIYEILINKAEKELLEEKQK